MAHVGKTMMITGECCIYSEMWSFYGFADPELAVNEHNIIRKLKEFSPKDWRALGVMLQLESTDLDTIEANNPKDVEKCLTSVIVYWIRKKEATWKKLWEALRDKSVGYNNIGIDIREWFEEKTRNDQRVRIM